MGDRYNLLLKSESGEEWVLNIASNRGAPYEHVDSLRELLKREFLRPEVQVFATKAGVMTKEERISNTNN